MKSLPYLVCAFYTDDDIYREYADNLRASLVAHRLPHDITRLPADHFKGKAAGQWKGACQWKPVFILTMMAKHPTKDILYLDADAAVLSHPTLFDQFDGDLGVVLRPPGELFASTIYVKNNARAREAVNAWALRVHADPKNDDQTMLQRTVDDLEVKANTTIVGLPGTYAYKFAESGAVAVIGQYQASRKVRAKNCGKAP